MMVNHEEQGNSAAYAEVPDIELGATGEQRRRSRELASKLAGQ